MIEKIKHVVVLMLENRSFDHMLGTLPGVDGFDPGHHNLVDVGSPPYVQTVRNNFLMPQGFDPKHEFCDVATQLGAARDMSGFAADARGTAHRMLPGFDALPADQQRAVVQSVMDCFGLGTLPALHTLSQTFAVCDRWFASVPGPTWPNRFFAMMGSCHGRLLMPGGPLGAVIAVRSIAAQLGKSSIFSVLGPSMHQIYTDYPTPLSALLKGANMPLPMQRFKADAAAGTLPAFSWIEPNFSAIVGQANSQHPPENVLRGDALIAEVYNTLRDKPLWASTLLVVLYDEHGGFYDHVPPHATVAPDDCPADVDFDFSYTGVRVPALLVSPWVKRGVVKDQGASPIYDHTSLLAFVCDQFGLSGAKASLGRRVACARHFGTADIWRSVPDDSAPVEILSTPVQPNPSEAASSALHDALPGLVSGLAAHAEVEVNRNLHQGLMMFNGREAAARQHIIDAWNRGTNGRTEDEVQDMLRRVKRMFGGDPIGH